MASSEPSEAEVASFFKTVTDQVCSGHDVSAEEADRAVTLIAEGRVCDIQTAAFITALKCKGECAAEILGFAQAMRRKAEAVPLPEDLSAEHLVDIVGTGGDGHNTVNISTSAAILAAAAGARVAKHGSVSVSSRSGSADVLRSLGIAMLPAAAIGPCIAQCGMAFMFAPLFHPAMSKVAPVRRALKIRTVFNILGPLLNPTGAGRLMLGVYSPALLDSYAQALAALGVQHALVVHCCGLDELAPIGVAEAREIGADGAISSLTIDTADWVPPCSIADLEGGEPGENADIIRGVFAGGDAAACPVGHTIALNAGAALYVAGVDSSVRAGYEHAFRVLSEGGAAKQLQQWADTSQALHESTAEK